MGDDDNATLPAGQMPTGPYVQLPVERPPSTEFDLSWATPEEQGWVMERMRWERRQTMNLRLMPTARLLTMRARPDATLIGWAGMDYRFRQGFPEFFSLYLAPEYRSYLVGLVLETARCLEALRNGVKRAYVRMESATNEALLTRRKSTGVFTGVERSELPADFLEMCKQCELHGNHCASQAFLLLDVEAFAERALRRIGPINVEDLPLRVQLDPSKMRKEPRAGSPSGYPFQFSPSDG